MQDTSFLPYGVSTLTKKVKRQTVDFCNNFEPCNMDFAVTGNKAMAMATTATAAATFQAQADLGRPRA